MVGWQGRPMADWVQMGSMWKSFAIAIFSWETAKGETTMASGDSSCPDLQDTEPSVTSRKELGTRFPTLGPVLIYQGLCWD